MNILMVSNHSLPDVGGVQSFVHCLASSLVQRGNDVSVLVPGYYKRRITHDASYKFLFSPNLPWIPQRFVKTVWNYVAKLSRNMPKFDIIHAQMIYPAGYDAISLGDILDVPVVLTPHGVDILTNHQLKYGFTYSSNNHNIVRKVISGSTSITYNSQSVLHELVRYGAVDEQCYFLPNGTFLANYAFANKRAVRKIFSVPEDSKIVVTVMRNSKVKGVDRLFELIRMFKNNNDNVFFFIGMTDGLAFEKRLMQEGLLNIARVFTDVGLELDEFRFPVIPSQKVVQLLVASDIYLSPSISGTFEISIIEGLAANLPVVVSEEIGIHEYIKKYDLGFVVDGNNVYSYYEAIKRLFSNRTLYAHFQKNILHHIKELDWNNVASNCQDIYIHSHERYYNVGSSLNRVG